MFMNDYTIIFIGKSGSGKGTQIKLLSDFFAQKYQADMYHLQSGQGLRELASSESHTGSLLRDALAHGKLGPTAIAIWSWVSSVVKDFAGQKVFFVDGAPRKLNEAIIMDEMFDFFDRKNRYIIHVDVSNDWSKNRLYDRQRSDDTDQSIDTRLGWFEQNSPDILSFFEQTGKYKMFKINGEQSIEDVQKNIIGALNI